MQKLNICVIEDDLIDYHCRGTDIYAPINWLCKEFLREGIPRRLFIKAYEKYTLSLEKIEIDYGQSATLTHLRLNAERHLKKLCDIVLYDIYDALEDDENNKNLLNDAEKFEMILV